MGKIKNYELYRYEYDMIIDSITAKMQGLIFIDESVNKLGAIIKYIREKENIYKWNVETKILYDTIRFEKERILDKGCE